MASQRRRERTERGAATAGAGLAEEAVSSRRLARGETTEEAPGEPGEPAGFGTEATTSQTDDVVLDSYEVPAGRTARVVEVSMSLESNGEASAHLNGTTYGPFTGAVDVSLPFDGAFLLPGSTVKVTHESTDGADTSTKATVTVREV